MSVSRDVVPAASMPWACSAARAWRYLSTASTACVKAAASTAGAPARRRLRLNGDEMLPRLGKALRQLPLALRLRGRDIGVPRCRKGFLCVDRPLVAFAHGLSGRRSLRQDGERPKLVTRLLHGGE